MGTISSRDQTPSLDEDADTAAVKDTFLIGSGREYLTIRIKHNDISRFKREDQEKIEEYLKTNKKFRNLCSAVNGFREILGIKDDSRLENWLNKTKQFNIR